MIPDPSISSELATGVENFLQGNSSAAAEPDRTIDERFKTPPKLIEPEPAVAIHAGAGGKLIVPREDLDAGLDDGEEVDLVSDLRLKIRKPDRREWIVLKRDSELTVRLLVRKPDAGGFDEEYYYVDKTLRSPIEDELKCARVFLYYSLKTKSFSLWIIKVTVDHSWYESLNKVLGMPPDFFASSTIRVISDTSNHRYRVKKKTFTAQEIAWPQKPMNELFGESLGPDHLITSSAHPIYRDLVDGEELL